MVATFSAVVEILWWAFIALLLGAFALRAVRDRRRRTPAAEDTIGPVVRRFEEEQLARMEAEGVQLWRPDPAKLKRIAERQD